MITPLIRSAFDLLIKGVIPSNKHSSQSYLPSSTYLLLGHLQTFGNGYMGDSGQTRPKKERHLWHGTLNSAGNERARDGALMKSNTMAVLILGGTGKEIKCFYVGFRQRRLTLGLTLIPSRTIHAVTGLRYKYRLFGSARDLRNSAPSLDSRENKLRSHNGHHIYHPTSTTLSSQPLPPPRHSQDAISVLQRSAGH
jgi:hypothetical protein